MIGYVGVEEQVDKDFHRARLAASVHSLRERLGGRSGAHEGRLLSYDEAKAALRVRSQAYRGVRTVEVEKITGSVGRYRDFDASFLPKKRNMCERWSRIDRAYHKGEELPAVSLYKIGESYFVRDGNHRVSVARYHGVVWIDAEVVELRGRTRTGAVLSPQLTAGTPKHRERHRGEGGASPLHRLWQRLRPSGPGNPQPAV